MAWRKFCCFAVGGWRRSGELDFFRLLAHFFTVSNVKLADNVCTTIDAVLAVRVIFISNINVLHTHTEYSLPVRSLRDRDLSFSFDTLSFGSV